MKRPDSPTFLVVRDLKETIDYFCRQACGEDVFLTVLTESERKILQIFAEGEASPGEIDGHGNSLLHAILYALGKVCGFRGFSPSIQHCITQFVEALLSLGVSANTTNDHGDTTLEASLELSYSCGRTSDQHYDCTEVVLDAGGYLCNFPTWINEWQSVPERIRLTLIEDFEDSPICQAILSQSVERLRNCLSGNPRLANDTVKGRFKPLSLCVPWPQGLQVLRCGSRRERGR